MESEIAVIGAGIVGLSTAHALCEDGVRCTVYERGVPGNGQSGGESRIFRHAHDDPRLIEIAKRARGIWDEWQEGLGVELVSDDGAIAIGDGVAEHLELLERAGDVPARELDGAELGELMPALASFDGPAMIDERGGAIRTTAAIEALSRELGDGLVADEVLSISNIGGEVEVRTGGRTARHAATVVCAGRGSLALARGVGIELPIEPAAHVRLTFAVAGTSPDRLPCLQDSSGKWGESGIYAAPTPGNRSYAVGLSDTTVAGADSAQLDPGSLAELARRAAAYVERALPGLDAEPLEPRHCWVTALPWSDDGVGVWSSGSIHVVAGHNLFKQAPALGRELAALARGGTLSPELRPEAKLGEPR
jgi:sarcosine oxidase